MKLLQFTDFHLRLTPAPESQFHVQPFWPADNDQLFSRLATAMQGMDAIAFTGDAAHGGGQREVEVFFDLLAGAAAGKPVFMVLGNHDVVHPDWDCHFSRSLKKHPNFKLHDGVYPLGKTDIVLINNNYVAPDGSFSPSWTSGHFPVPVFSPDQAAKLDAALSRSTSRPTIALIHCPDHVPPPVLYDFGKGVLAGMESYQNDLNAMLDKHPRVALMLSGHVHFNSVKIHGKRRVSLSLASVGEYPYPFRIIEIDEMGLRTRLGCLATDSDAEVAIEFAK